MAFRASLLSINAWLVLLLTATDCADQTGNALTQYVDWFEAQVEEIAKQAVQNDEQSCELLKTCQGNCSRHACTPQHDDLDKLSCVSVTRNIDCAAFSSNKTCQTMSLSLSKSYVRLPPSLHKANQDLVRESPPYISRTVCAQRMLDPLFQKIWNNSQYEKAWIFFGSIEGVQRSFPGREVSPYDCVTYDPRKRPWFIAVATSVLKDLVILLDYGSSMSNPFTDVNNIEKYSVGVSITQDLLDTLSQGDRVTAFRFDSSNATDIFKVTINADLNLASTKNLLENIPTDSISRPSNLSLAIPMILGTFNQDSNLKIIMIFTDSNVIGIETIQSKVPKNTLLFIFMLGATSDDDLNRLSSSSLNTSIVWINDTYQLENPLWAIRSFFDVMAQLRFSNSGGKAYWVSSFDDKEGLGKTLTVAYPAFDNSTHLVGVAGIDTIVSQLPSGFDDIVSTRPGSYPSNVPSTFKYSITVQDKEQCSTSLQSGLCDGESNYSYLQLLCCGICQLKNSKSFSYKVVIAIAVCSVVALLALIAILICVLKKIPKQNRSTVDPIEVQDESVDQVNGSTEWSKPL